MTRLRRVKQGLRERYRVILSYVGSVLVIGGALMLTPLAALAVWPQEKAVALSFVGPAAVTLVVGLVLWRALRPAEPAVLTLADGGVIVVLSWVGVTVASAAPLVLAERLSFTQAVFEAVSGWSTTGLSVVDVTGASHVVLLWRSVMQLAGGAGLAIIMLASITGPVGTGLPAAEGRSEQLAPHVRRSAMVVLRIYAAYTAFGVIALALAGMKPFDAINHAFAAVSTGGFSTYPDSIGHWDSPTVEVVAMVLMVAGSLSYITAMLLFRGKWRAVLRNGEVRAGLALLIVAAVCVLLALLPGNVSIARTMRIAVFETLSALTSTGFCTTGYAGWPSVAVLAMIVLMLIGGGTCSTAGGMKQYRVYVLWKALVWHLRRAFLPPTAVVEEYIWQGENKDYIASERIRQVGVFVVFFLAVYVLGAAALCAHGYTLEQGLFEFASAMSTIGLSVGITSPQAPASVLWILTSAMFMGRLEFLVVVIGVARIARDACTMLRRA